MNLDDYEPKHLSKMTPMWLFPYLLEGDRQFGTHRWEYWGNTLTEMAIPDEPIPYVNFAAPPNKETIKHIAQMIDQGSRYGQRHSDTFEALVVWILHGLGDPEFKEYDTPDKIPYLKAPIPLFDFWYEKFELGRLQMHPHDYLAHFAQGGENKGYNPYSGSGFFATPGPVCAMMAQMTFSGADPQATKIMSVDDPCCGTGSLLLAASNYSLNLYGQDISLAMTRMTRLNGWLYAPWMVFWPSFPLLDFTVERIKNHLFGQGVPGMTPDPETIPPVPVPTNVMHGEFKQTEKGQYILPLFEDLVPS
jgi:hypothetical protein